MSAKLSLPGVLTRRAFLGAGAAGAASMALSACTMVPDAPPVAPAPEPGFGDFATMYGPKVDEGYQLPAIPYEKIDPQYLRQIVPDPTGEKPGTIVVDASRNFLYLVRDGGRAIRYGVSLGRAGFEWTGSAVVQWKKKWPVWVPPPEMIERDPSLGKYSAENGGMPPGPNNPLGARAHYLFNNGVDTMYRLHGTPAWDSIGKAASSGCVRLLNQDVMDLYERVQGQVPVHVRPGLDRPKVARSSQKQRGTAIDAGVPKDAVLLK